MELREKLGRIKEIRYEIESSELFNLSDDISQIEEYKELCLDLAEEALERESQAEAIDVRIKELQARKSRLMTGAETIRNLVLQCMEVRNEKTISSPCLTLSVSNIKPDIVINDESSIPSEFFTPQPPKLDKKRLKEAVLKDGEIVDGVSMGNGKISLTIRRK